MNKDKVSRAVIGRLPGYYRYLCNLEKNGLVRISSQQLGERMGLTASQIRQDINCFGGFGQQGYGYNIPELRRSIGQILGLEREYHCIVVGAGNIGQAVSVYQSFRSMGFQVRALFDAAVSEPVKTRNDLTVYPSDALAEYLAMYQVDIGVIAVPESAAQLVCDNLVAGGVKAIWNFAPVDLVVPPDVTIQSVHLSDALLVLAYYMSQSQKKEP